MTRRAGVIGWPVGHSRSPIIHDYWLRQHHIDGIYQPLPIPPEQIASFLRDFAASGLVGANVTLPHKEAALAAVAHAEAVAVEIGAVNTLWLEGGRLLGTNTDAEGFLANLDASAPGWAREGGPALVIGAGGAARAIVYALKERAFAPVTIVNRTRSRADDLAERFGVKSADWSDLPRLLARSAVLVNTSSLGMVGQPALDLDLAPLQPEALVTDIVYTPLETPLLAAARARGLRTVDGLGMLLHQAVPGFERWFGIRPDVTPELRAAILETIPA